MLEMAMIRPPRLLRDQPPGGLLRAEEDALEVVAENEVPVFLGHLDDRRLPDQPGVVHENVEAAELAVGLGERAGDLVGEADVALDRAGLAAEVGDRFDDLLGLVEVQVEDGHVRPFAHERLDNRLADARRPAGNDCPLALQSHSDFSGIRKRIVSSPVGVHYAQSAFRRQPGDRHRVQQWSVAIGTFQPANLFAADRSESSTFRGGQTRRLTLWSPGTAAVRVAYFAPSSGATSA